MNYLFAYEAEMMMNDGFIREGIELCKKGLRDYPTYTVAYSVLANGYILLQDYDSALTTIEAALDRYPENKSLLYLRGKLNDIFNNSNQFVIGDSIINNYEIESGKKDEKIIYIEHKILNEEEVEKLYNEYKTENIILTNGRIEQFVHSDFDSELFGQINNFENLRDLIASFKEEKHEIEKETETEEERDYFSLVAGRIGDGKLIVKQEVTKPTDSDDEPYLVSETMAQIYEIQKAYTTAIKVYNKLCEKFPEKKEKFQEKISELKNKLN
ncbi:MAG: tetratricopeptide repeat protein [Bacteroidetes bacterium]|nr:MAG: tetratricopeptide repeat protein [Bacteroidota bacterium]